MAKPPAKPKYDLRLALDWGEKIAKAIENPSFDDRHKLAFCYGRQTVQDRTQRPGRQNCKCVSIAADPGELAKIQRELMVAFRALCTGR